LQIVKKKAVGSGLYKFYISKFYSPPAHGLTLFSLRGQTFYEEALNGGKGVQINLECKSLNLKNYKSYKGLTPLFSFHFYEDMIPNKRKFKLRRRAPFWARGTNA
jgi:hypothetical protein